MRSTDTPTPAGHQLDLQDLTSAHLVQGLPDEQLLTTVLMEQGTQSEADRIQRSLDTGLHQSAELYATKSSPEHCFTGYNFKRGQDMMVHAAFNGASVDQQVELVPIQVVPSQALSLGQGMVTMDGMQVPGGYRMADLEGQSGYPLQCSQSQGQQFTDQAQHVMTGSESSVRQLCQTATRMDPHGRPTKVLVQHRSGSGAQPGLQVQRQVRRVTRALSDSDIVIDGTWGAAMGAGSIGHHVLGGIDSMAQACSRGGTPAMADSSDRCGVGVGGKEATKTRWKPNPVQLCLLEQHFNSGYTKATPELHAAVQGAGHATENQVTVWLKNRLSRCKRPPPKAKPAELPKPEEENENEAPWLDFAKLSASVLEELSSILSTVDKEDVTLLAHSIKGSKKICCFGVGREGLVMKALASSLHHLGFEAFCTGDTNMPQFGGTDLMLVSAGPSYYSSVSALALEAMRAGAMVIAFTAHKTADLPFAGHVIRIPAQTFPPSMPVINQSLTGAGADVVSFLPKGKMSLLQMGASFEMSLWLMFECVSIMLRRVCHVSPSEMRARHTNLE